MDSEISEYVSKLANLVDDAAVAYNETEAPVSISVDLDEHWVATFHHNYSDVKNIIRLTNYGLSLEYPSKQNEENTVSPSIVLDDGIRISVVFPSWLHDGSFSLHNLPLLAKPYLALREFVNANPSLWKDNHYEQYESF